MIRRDATCTVEDFPKEDETLDADTVIRPPPPDPPAFPLLSGSVKPLHENAPSAKK